MKNINIDNILFAGEEGIKSLFRKIAIGSIFIGCFALIVSISVLEGFESELNTKAINFDSHIRVSTFNREAIEDSKTKIEQLNNEFKLNSVFPIIEDSALLKSKDERDGLLLKGVDSSYIQRKDFLSSDFISENSKWIILGKSKAIHLGVGVGDTVILMNYNEELSLSSIDKFICVGLFETGFGDFDNNLAYIDYEDAQKFFAYKPDDCSVFEIYLDEPKDAQIISDAIGSFLGWPIYSQSVFEIHQSTFAWIEIQKEPIPLVLGLISLVAAFNIITVFLINIVDKYKSIGILRCMGLSSSSIVLIFIKQGMKLGAKGVVMGSGFAFILLEMQRQFQLISLPSEIYFLSFVPVAISPWIFLYVATVTMVLTFLVSIIPAFIAGKIKPISAINFD